MDTGRVQVPWSTLPEELVDSISNRFSSNIDLIHIRSICKPWRSAVATTKRIPDRFKPILPPFNGTKSLSSTSTFLRVSDPSSPCPDKGWLIITKQNPKSGKTSLVSPFSRGLNRDVTLDLLKFGVSEFRQSIEIGKKSTGRIYIGGNVTGPPLHSVRVVLVENLVIAVDSKNKLWFCKNGEESDNEWVRIKSHVEEASFWDITVHKGQTYVLDFEGVIWWLRLSDLTLIQFTPSGLVMYYYNTFHHSRYMRLVEYCGELCIVHRVWSTEVEMNDSFKVYRMDQELMTWVQVSSLEDKTIIVTKDSCFTVLASDYYECLPNAIYFFDKDCYPKVFKLEDGGIIEMVVSSSYFQMFSPPFLRKNVISLDLNACLTMMS